MSPLASYPTSSLGHHGRSDRATGMAGTPNAVGHMHSQASPALHGGRDQSTADAEPADGARPLSSRPPAPCELSRQRSYGRCWRPPHDGTASHLAAGPGGHGRAWRVEVERDGGTEGGEVQLGCVGGRNPEAEGDARESGAGSKVGNEADGHGWGDCTWVCPSSQQHQGVPIQRSMCRSRGTTSPATHHPSSCRKSFTQWSRPGFARPNPNYENPILGLHSPTQRSAAVRLRGSRYNSRCGSKVGTVATTARQRLENSHPLLSISPESTCNAPPSAYDMTSVAHRERPRNRTEAPYGYHFAKVPSFPSSSRFHSLSELALLAWLAAISKKKVSTISTASKPQKCSAGV